MSRRLQPDAPQGWARARRTRGNRRTAAALLLAAAWAVAAPGTAAAQPAPLEGLDDYVLRSMEAWDIPGLALAVVHGDSVLHARGYGVRELGREATVDEYTIFAVASTTKAFTAAALAMLVDQDELDWDDRVIDHLPGFRLADAYATREVTIRDLLAHRTGLPRCDRVWYGTSFGRAEILRRIRHCEPVASLRSRYGYQNVMYLAAGRIAGAVSGTSWDEVVDERLFVPLGMSRSSTSVRDLEGASNVAAPHMELDGELRPVSYRDMDNIGPAGSINSSVYDMARWIRLQLRDGVFADDTLLSAASVEDMRSPHTLIPGEAPFLPEPSPYLAYGLGWALHQYRGVQVVEHAGGIDGMRSEVALVPERDLGLVVLANRDGPSLGTPLLYRIVDAFLGAPATDWTGHYGALIDSLDAEPGRRDRRLREARREGTSPSRALAEYAGSYTDSLYGEVRIREEEGRLVLAYHTFEDRLAHWHFDTFHVDWRSDLPAEQSLASALVSFRLDTRGEVEALHVPGMTTFRRADSGDRRGAGALR